MLALKLGLNPGSTAPRPILVLACGNPSRGDDALGPMLLERLACCQAQGGVSDCDLLTDFQLQVEHALDLLGRRLVIFVDAGTSGQGPYTFTQVRPEAGAEHSTHVLGPAAVLHTYLQVAGQIKGQIQGQIAAQTDPGPCPEAWLLAIRGYRFELGDGLSDGARANLDAASAFLETYLRDRSAT